MRNGANKGGGSNIGQKETVGNGGEAGGKRKQKETELEKKPCIAKPKAVRGVRSENPIPRVEE